MNLVDNFLNEVIRLRFLKGQTGDDFDKMQVLSGFVTDNVWMITVPIVMKLVITVTEKSSCYNKESTNHPLCNFN